MTLCAPDPTPNEERLCADLGAALDQLADMRDRLDRALVESERYQRSAQACSDRSQLLAAQVERANGRSERLVGLLERAVSTLLRLGHADEASELQAALSSALERV